MACVQRSRARNGSRLQGTYAPVLMSCQRLDTEQSGLKLVLLERVRAPRATAST